MSVSRHNTHQKMPSRTLSLVVMSPYHILVHLCCACFLLSSLVRNHSTSWWQALSLHCYINSPYDWKRKVTPAQFSQFFVCCSLVALSCLWSEIACHIISANILYACATISRTGKNHDLYTIQWAGASQMTWWWHTLAFWYDSTITLKLIFSILCECVASTLAIKYRQHHLMMLAK